MNRKNEHRNNNSIYNISYSMEDSVEISTIIEFPEQAIQIPELMQSIKKHLKIGEGLLKLKNQWTQKDDNIWTPKDAEINLTEKLKLSVALSLAYPHGISKSAVMEYLEIRNGTIRKSISTNDEISYNKDSKLLNISLEGVEKALEELQQHNLDPGEAKS